MSWMNGWTKGRVSVLAALLIGLAGCGGGGGSTGPSSGTLSGQAVFPAQVGGGVAANAPFIVRDLAQAGAPTVFSGTTDGAGNYSAPVSVQAAIAIIVNGTAQGRAVRVSGLLHPNEQGKTKSFTGTTDIACQAGISAVLAGTVPAFSMNAQRIQNLELAAARLAGGVNFFDLPGSVVPAANTVNAQTNFGAFPPP